MANIKEVAKKAGVSPATVSRVINDRPYVADAIRERVLEAIRELQYHPNRVAQRLRAEKSHLVGVLLSDIGNPFNTQVLEGIEQVLSQQGLSVFICNSATRPERENDFIALMQAEEVAGIIIVPTRETSDALAGAVASGLPVVVIDRRMTKPITDVVIADNENGARLAVQHFIEQGYRRIATIAGPKHLTSGRERYQGFVRALEEFGVPLDESLVRFGDYQMESSYNLTRELIAAAELPLALFCANNLMTIGALNAIHEAGLRIPDDVALIGFDELPWAVSLTPSLTTVEQPALQIGIHAAELLLNRVTYPSRPSRTVVLNTQLIIRASALAPSPQAGAPLSAAES